MEPRENSLNIKVSAASLLKYALPTILSGISMNIYSIIDQLFVSNLPGTDALSAVSIAGPSLAIALAIGTMIAPDGCALVSIQMGGESRWSEGASLPENTGVGAAEGGVPVPEAGQQLDACRPIQKTICIKSDRDHLS